MDQELRFNTLLLEYVSTLSIKKQSSFGINADKYNQLFIIITDDVEFSPCFLMS